MKQVIHIHEILPYTFNSIVTSPDGTVLQNQHVKGSPKKYKTIYNDDVTIVILEDGSKGIARLGHRDRYNRQIGHDIAYNRAKIKSLEREIKQISETQFVEERRL